MGGYAYAANPATLSDPSGLCADPSVCGPPTTGGGGSDNDGSSGGGGSGSNTGGQIATGLGILGAGGSLIRLTSPSLPEPPPGFPQWELNQFGIENYLRVLDATRTYFSDNPQAYARFDLMIARTTMADGVSRTLAFASKGTLPRGLVNEFESLGVGVFQIEDLPKSASRAETAARAYVETQDRLPVDQQIRSVEDAYTTNEACSTACARDLTSFIGRKGVTIPEGSYGYLAGRIVNSTTLDEWRAYTGLSRAIDVAAEAYLQFSNVAGGEAATEEEG